MFLITIYRPMTSPVICHRYILRCVLPREHSSSFVVVIELFLSSVQILIVSSTSDGIVSTCPGNGSNIPILWVTFTFRRPCKYISSFTVVLRFITSCIKIFFKFQTFQFKSKTRIGEDSLNFPIALIVTTTGNPGEHASLVIIVWSKIWIQGFIPTTVDDSAFITWTDCT